MKIALISSAMDSLALFKFLHRYDHEFLIYFDSLNAPYGEKSLKVWLSAAKAWILRAKEQAADAVILPPVLELACLNDKEMTNEERSLILPLFSHYLCDEVFPHSLVGKLGLFGEGEILRDAQELISQLSASFQPTKNQQNTKKFVFPFNFWSKDTRIFSHLLQKLARKSLLVNTVIKQDLRYFKDAAVDSLIPLNYSYFLAERTISKFLNFRKIRFHWFDALERTFKSLTQGKENSPYAVKIHSTDSALALTSSKKMLRLLQRGQQTEIQRC